MGAQDLTAIRERLPQPTRAERQVADLLPIGADRRRLGDPRAVPLWFHTFSLDARRALHARGGARPPLPDPRRCPTTSPGRACSTSAPSTASMPSSPSPVAPDGSWRSTTSSTGSGCAPGGASSSRAARASARSPSSWLGGRVPAHGRVRARPARGALRPRSTASGSCTGSRTRSGCCGCCGAGSRERRARAGRDLRGRRRSWSGGRDSCLGAR